MTLNKNLKYNLVQLISHLEGFEAQVFIFGYVNADGQYLHYFDIFYETNKIR